MFVISAANNPKSHLRGQSARGPPFYTQRMCTVRKHTKYKLATRMHFMSVSCEQASLVWHARYKQAHRLAARGGLVWSRSARSGRKRPPGTRDRERRAATQRFLSRLRLATNIVWMNSLRVWPNRSEHHAERTQGHIEYLNNHIKIRHYNYTKHVIAKAANGPDGVVWFFISRRNPDAYFVRANKPDKSSVSESWLNPAFPLSRQK